MCQRDNESNFISLTGVTLEINLIFHLDTISEKDGSTRIIEVVLGIIENTVENILLNYEAQICKNCKCKPIDMIIKILTSSG